MKQVSILTFEAQKKELENYKNALESILEHGPEFDPYFWRAANTILEAYNLAKTFGVLTDEEVELRDKKRELKLKKERYGSWFARNLKRSIKRSERARKIIEVASNKKVYVEGTPKKKVVRRTKPTDVVYGYANNKTVVMCERIVKREDGYPRRKPIYKPLTKADIKNFVQAGPKTIRRVAREEIDV